MKIYLDMDGVLANFDKLMMATFNKHFDEIGRDSQDRWNIISEALPLLYRHLDKMSGADDLVVGTFALAEQYGYGVGVLTAIPRLGKIPNVVTHKRLWVQERYPQLLTDFNIGPHAIHKQQFAKPGHVLIDDSSLNIDQWNAAGGFGILHTDAQDSLTKLKHFLEEYSATISTTPQ